MAADAPAAYIRGTTGAQADTRRAAWWLGTICLLALAGLGVAVALGAVRQHTRDLQLSRARTPVQATVTGCLGMASGTGITASGYVCTASFVLDGRRHDAVIARSRRVYRPGTVIDALTDPRDPSVLVARRVLTGA